MFSTILGHQRPCDLFTETFVVGHPEYHGHRLHLPKGIPTDQELIDAVPNLPALKLGLNTAILIIKFVCCWSSRYGGNKAAYQRQSDCF